VTDIRQIKEQKMTLQLIICVIAAALVAGSAICATSAMDQYDENRDKYTIWSFGMMLGGVVAILFLLFGHNGMLDGSSGNAAEFPSVNITSTSIQN
jgi:hypothetical protein